MRRSALLASVLCVASLAIVASAVAKVDRSSESSSATDRQAVVQPRSRAGALQIGQTVGIAGRSYLVIDALQAVARIPHPTVKMVATLVRQCRRAQAFGFAATGPVDVGVVAWVPTNILDCWVGGDDVTGGGPIEPVRPAACVQGFRTPDRRTYVLFAGSSVRVCSHISTQAPGGFSGETLYAVQGLPARSRVLVKCQGQSEDGVLWDFVSTYAAKLPASKNAWWIRDAWVYTGYDWIPGVPSCGGTRFQW